MDYRFMKLAQYVRGWMSYFGISDYYRPIPEIDHWLRRRMRMCYWKQWRYVRTKVRNLLALGTSKRQAILTALSSKSYWRLSRTLATQSGMTNEWLQRQGLIGVRDLWMKARISKLNREWLADRLLRYDAAGSWRPHTKIPIT